MQYNFVPRKSRIVESLMLALLLSHQLLCCPQPVLVKVEESLQCSFH